MVPMTVPLLQIDAFTSVPLRGNPAAVALLDGPAEAPRPGDRILFDIGYHDQCVHLHEALYPVRDGVVLGSAR